MTLVHHWSHPTTPAGVGWDIVVPNAVELVTEKGFAARAGLGEADVIQVTVDDPAGIYDFKRGHRWYMVETSIAAGNQLVWNGYIGDQEISRGGGGALFPSGSEHQWELHVVQENTLLTFRVIQGAATPAAGKRAAENANVRLTWLLGSAFLATVIDHGLIDWTGLATFAMDAVDYRGQTGADVLRDIGLISGYNHYIRYRETTGDIELACYDPNTSNLDSSTLQVSNVAADLDAGAVFATNSIYPPDETAGPVKLVRKGDRVAAGIYLPYAMGAVYGTNVATSYKFAMIDQVAPAAKVKTLAKANALLARLLIQHNAQDERITNLRIQLQAANLNDVKHGQLINAKFSHLPGYEGFRRARVVSKSFSRPLNQAQGLYDVDLELSPREACSTGTTVTSIYDSGTLGPSVAPAGVTIPTPAVGSVMFGMFGANQGNTSINGPLTLSAPWTLQGSFAPAYYNHDLSAVGYLVTPATPAGNFTANGMTGGNFIWRTLGFKIATNATAPLQSATQATTGSIITLPNPLTAGSILILAAFFDDTAIGTGLVDLSVATNAGFVQIASVTARDTSLAQMQMALLVKCVSAGDSNAVQCVENSFSHWQYLSEWKLT